MVDAHRPNMARPVTPTLPPPSSSSSSQVRPGHGHTLNIPASNGRPLSNIGPLSPVNQYGSFAFDRVIKSGTVQRRVKKKGAWKSSWKPTYLVLRPNLLSVYKDEHETELKASITLSDVTAVAPVKKSKHEHVFGIFSPYKNYHFAGLSARETSDWITLIRAEARTEDQEDLQPPTASFQHAGQPGYETTDLSAEDDLEVAGSPEAAQWHIRGPKSRVAPQANPDARKSSGQPMYSGNESFATSQSDFSDGLSSSVPGSKGYLSTSGPVQPSSLTPIPDDAPSAPRPIEHHQPSYLSDAATPTPVNLSRSAPKPIPAQVEGSRIVRQGHVKLSKTISGVRQWKTVWMVLRVQSLALFKSSHDVSPIATIPASNIIEAAEIDQKHKQNCFQVISEDKTYRLQADSEDDLESWLGAFKSVLVKQEAERERTGPHASVSQSQSQGPLKMSAGGGVVRPPASRDGPQALTGQMRNVSLDNTPAAARRMVIAPPAGTTVHTQVTGQMTPAGM